MITSTLTYADLVFIEADLRNQSFCFTCKDCRYRTILADKIMQLAEALGVCYG